MGLFTTFDSFITVLYKKCLLFSLISRYFNICSSNVFFHSEMEKFKETFSLNGYPAHLWIVVSNHFLITLIILVIKFIPARKRLYIFVFLSLVIMVCKFDHNFRNLFLLPIHTFLYVSSFILLSVFRISFHLRTKFPVN
jgi:heme exporter protein D